MSISAKRYERMMKANGINQAPPSIRDAPTASRPRKKKTSPDPPPTSPIKKRKLAKSEEVVNDRVKTKREERKPKVEKGASTKSDPELLSSVPNGPNDYPWFNEATPQQTYDSQTDSDTTNLAKCFRDPGFEHTYGDLSGPQNPDTKCSILKNDNEASSINPNSLDANTAEPLTSKYPYLEIKDESTYVSPWELDLYKQYPYLSTTKREAMYASPYGPVETDTIMPATESISAHPSAFTLDHCTSSSMESRSSVGNKEVQPKQEEKEKEMGSILIAD